jgi:hypothetical protein
MNNVMTYGEYNAKVHGRTWTGAEASWPPTWLNPEPSPTLTEVPCDPAEDEKCDVTAVVPAIEPAEILPLMSRFADDPLDEWPEPCLCGSLAFWWDAFGGVHCQSCRPPMKALRLLRRAERIRRRMARNGLK